MLELNNIYNLNCLEGMQSMSDEYVDMVVTSPPYDNLRTYNKDIDKTWGEHVWKPIIKELFRVVKSGGVVVWIVNDATVDGSETGTSFRQALYFMECGFKLHDTMIWQKNSPFTHKTRYIPDFEYMFVFSKGNIKTANLICDRKNKWGGTAMHGTLQQKNDGVLVEVNGKSKGRMVKEYGARYNIWDVPPEKNNETGHPAVFPVSLIRDHIYTWSNEGEIVMDPFMGSGTTAIACIIEKRKYIGFETNKEYFDKSIIRVANLLKEPTLF